MFLNKFNITLKGKSGAWGNLIHGKNLKQKIKSRDTVPLMEAKSGRTLAKSAVLRSKIFWFIAIPDKTNVNSKMYAF